jgi:Secretion system C-terminal sorting domain
MKTIASLSVQTAVLCSMLFASSSPAADSTVNYDTAWTYVYDGGLELDSTPIPDDFYDVKTLPDGSCYCVGSTADSVNYRGTLLVKLSTSGKMLWKKRYFRSGGGRSIILAENGDLVIGGARGTSPLILRIDTAGNLKWATWLYDSVQMKPLYLSRGATVNCVRETSRGTIICAAGDYFTDAGYIYGSTNDNYAAFLELDSMGKVRAGSLNNTSGYNIGGFDIEEAPNGYYLTSGNQAINYFDTNGTTIWQKSYTFSLNGVGTEINNITRCKKLQNGTFIVAGQAYEGNCWTSFQHLYYDAWWSPINFAGGGNTTWDTAGYQGGDDRINDFTQLANGNLVFVGKKNYSNIQTTGIWVYVTPDTGSHILWEGVIAGSLYAGEPLSVCATPDTGFTVVGKVGGNAFAAHFVPGPLSGVTYKHSSTVPSFLPIVRLIGKHLVVTNATSNTMATVSLFDVSGKRVAMQTTGPQNSRGEVSFDISRLARGTYFVQVKNVGITRAEKIVVNRL